MCAVYDNSAEKAFNHVARKLRLLIGLHFVYYDHCYQCDANIDKFRKTFNVTNIVVKHP